MDALRLDIDSTSRRLTVIGYDPVGLPDVLSRCDRQIAIGAWSYTTLHDSRRVTWIPTEEEIRVIVAFVDSTSKTLGPRGAVAFVAPPPPVFEVARMYSHIGEGSALRAEIFQDVETATRWLDTMAND